MDTTKVADLLSSTYIHILLSVDALFSMILFFLYWFDKGRAKNGGWRTPEKTLHLLSLLGGWPGAILGQKIFRHKTKKSSFRILFYLTLLFNLFFQGWLIGVIIS